MNKKIVVKFADSCDYLASRLFNFKRLVPNSFIPFDIYDRTIMSAIMALVCEDRIKNAKRWYKGQLFFKADYYVTNRRSGGALDEIKADLSIQTPILKHLEKACPQDIYDVLRELFPWYNGEQIATSPHAVTSETIAFYKKSLEESKLNIEKCLENNYHLAPPNSPNWMAYRNMLEQQIELARLSEQTPMPMECPAIINGRTIYFQSPDHYQSFMLNRIFVDQILEFADNLLAPIVAGDPWEDWIVSQYHDIGIIYSSNGDWLKNRALELIAQGREDLFFTASEINNYYNVTEILPSAIPDKAFSNPVFTAAATEALANVAAREIGGIPLIELEKIAQGGKKVIRVVECREAIE